jgi:hypothetical protein
MIFLKIVRMFLASMMIFLFMMPTQKDFVKYLDFGWEKLYLQICFLGNKRIIKFALNPLEISTVVYIMKK